MATKPSATVVWAANTLYVGGPAAGNNTKEPLVDSATEGLVPGTGVASEVVNKVYNELGLWSVWLAAGVTTPDLDAHLVETTALGQINVALANFGNTASAFGAFIAQENSGATGETGRFINTVGGVALACQGNTGYALRLIQDTDAVGTPGAIRQTVRTSEPTTVLEGDLSFRGGDFHRPNFRDDNTWQYVHGSAGGFVRRYNEVAAETNTSSGGSLINKVAATLVSGDNAVTGTTVHIRAVCEVGTSVAGTIIKLGIVDGTAGGTPIISEGDGGAGTQRTIQTYQASSGADERYVVLEVDYVLPLSGTRIFFLGFTSNGADTSYIRFASIEVTGAF
jgi:hypothetical protein